MELLFGPSGLPDLSTSTQAFIRIAYGALLLLILLVAAPHWSRFFTSEKFRGYAESSPVTDFIQSPIMSWLIWFGWALCAVMIVLNANAVVAALINLVLCRYFFVALRWKGVLRGMGAPGFMTYWMALAVFLLEFTSNFAPESRRLAILVMQVDFAFIMLSAGVYKFTAGYAQNEGMEYGMVNPEWGYWYKFFSKLPPSSFLFRLLNHLAWSTEVVAAVFMIIPQTRFLGGLLIFISFVFIATQIRLTFLCEMVIAATLLFVHPHSIGDQLISQTVATAHTPLTSTPVGLWTPVSVLLMAYLVLLPLVHGGLFFNFYGRKRFSEPLQKILEHYANFFGVIIWRVFSVDVVNFFPVIYAKNSINTERRLISRYGWGGSLRFNHVGESITVTSLFTTLKYYAQNKDLFNQRLLRYSRTIPVLASETIEFEYHAIQKSNDTFIFVHAATFAVDLVSCSVSQQLFTDSSLLSSPHSCSPVFEGAHPGSYTPVIR